MLQVATAERSTTPWPAVWGARDLAGDPFLSEDPIGLDGGMNLYEYANDNPVLMNDPFGLEASPKPPASPSPKPTPRPSPKGPRIWHRPGHMLQNALNLCPEPYKLVFWDYYGANPHVASNSGAWKEWRDAFVDECNSIETKDTVVTSFFGIANPNPLGIGQFESSVGLGVCCRKCSKP